MVTTALLPVNFCAHINCHFLELSQCVTQVRKHIILLCFLSLYIKKEINVIIEKIVLSSIAHTSINSEDRPEFFPSQLQVWFVQDWGILDVLGQCLASNSVLCGLPSSQTSYLPQFKMIN